MKWIQAHEFLHSPSGWPRPLAWGGTPRWGETHLEDDPGHELEVRLLAWEELTLKMTPAMSLMRGCWLERNSHRSLPRPWARSGAAGWRGTHLEDDPGHELGVGLLAGEELADNFVHDVLWREEVGEEVRQYTRHHARLVRTAFAHSETSHVDENNSSLGYSVSL